MQFEVLPEERCYERDDGAGDNEQQQDGHTWILHIKAQRKIHLVDFHHHVVSVGSVGTACVVSQNLNAHHQVDVVSERPKETAGALQRN